MNINKEYKAEFDYVAYHYVTPFVQRWKKKISHMRKGSDEKAFVFDKFISEYVIFSALVNVIKPQEYKHKYDFRYCTKVIAEYLSDRIDTHFISQLSNPVSKLIEVIDSKQFKVVSSYNKNPELKENWATNLPAVQLVALLETLYYLRCNLFHGEKEYSDDQVRLLKPAYQSLQIINKKILSLYVEFGGL